MGETDEHRQPEAAPGPEPAPADYSEAIEQSLARRSNEELRCVRVFGDRYRCNWWRRDDGAAEEIAVRTVVRSKFLRVTRTAAGLEIEDLSDSGPR